MARLVRGLCGDAMTEGEFCGHAALLRSAASQSRVHRTKIAGESLNCICYDVRGNVKGRCDLNQSG
jgi:hypothetical protein